MLRLRTLVAFVGGVIVAILVGLIPSELIGWLRDWASQREPDSADDEASSPP